MIPRPRRKRFLALGTFPLFALPVLCATVNPLLLAFCFLLLPAYFL